jgi:Kef-type K+ transport system membrane component KefB
MLGATVVNVILMVAIFILLFWLYGRFIAPSVSTQATSYVMIVIFVGSIALTYFLYHRIVKWISKKWDLDEYFDPIFKRRKPQ